MAYDKDQNEFALPAGNNKDQRAANFLPKYFRTDTNKKFLSSTIDQMITPGVIEKIDAFAGRRFSKASLATDSYLLDVNADRENYQLEPVAVFKDELDNVEFLKDYNDYLGIIKNFRGSTSNHSLLNSQEFYAWDPHIDWDKFTNFREYYWLPFGPASVPVAGQSRDIVSTYTVSLVEDLGTISYLFSPDGTTRNPSLTLYRGQTYRFEINTPGYPFAIAIIRTITDSDPTLGIDITQTSTLYKEGVTTPSDYVEQGVIEFTVPETAPESLYYVSQNDPNISGIFAIDDITENSVIDVEKEILGKKTYKTSNGFELSNGMKIFFQGIVSPEKYKTGNWYVEGVGSAIKLVAETDLEIPAIFTSDTPVPFDGEGWDTLPFDDATSFAGAKDYVVINRASADRNPWSRYNRWFHRDVIRKSAELNGRVMDLDQESRAKRPIIEFEPGLKLFNHGVRSKANVTLVDDFTADVFSTIEGSVGYNIDQVDISDGMRILFTADPDKFVNGKIFEVKFIVHQGRRQISLIETTDTNPVEGEVVLVLNGVQNKGKMFYYTGTEWKKSQEKTSVNQAPLFDIFDQNGIAFNDQIEYPNSTFAGNKIFSYRQGFGPNDAELGFPVNYRSIANLGDIVFDFNLLSETVNYQPTPQTSATKSTDLGYIKRYNYLGNSFEYVNAWQKADKNSQQAVLRQYVASSSFDSFAVDVFDNSGQLSDLIVRVFLNGTRQRVDEDYRFEIANGFKTVIFNKPIKASDIVLLKCYSSADKNKNGFYEIPSNFERNPLNDNIVTFTLGEVNDHVDSIVENLDQFVGVSPGENNLRDLGPVSKYGRKFVQHSGPLNLALFHLTDKNANIIKAIKFAKKEYSRFKRQFLLESENIVATGTVKEQFDAIMNNINKDRIKDQPFYFSDMLAYGNEIKNSYIVPQNGPRFIPLTRPFSLDELTNRAVNIYVNGQILKHKKDYIFSENFVSITVELSEGDVVEVCEYESTNGSFIPPTPTKLGLYPCYEPQIFVDNTYSTPQTMIQGHDGSLIVAFNDYRDQLILELETRIYNNIKNKYQNDILDLYDLLPSKYRNTGITLDKINNIMLADFSQWLELVGSPDYTDTAFWDKDKPFTYNYSFMGDREGMPLKGFWRNIFKFYYDTDRPHTHPWEMLGFTIKPSWWEDVYGPAPYTRNNTVLWKDLSEGLVKEPGKLPIRNKKFARPDLLSIIPVDEFGRLLDPLSVGIAQNFVLTKTKTPFEFGDHAPVEAAWRRSSDFAFSLIIAWTLIQPAKMFGLGFDTSKIVRDLTGNLVYSKTGKRLRTADLEFPCVCVVEDLKITSGLVNYISNYLASYRITNQVSANYLKYQEILKGLNNQLAIKLGGFADKSKIKLVLDSRTPLNKGNVFVPDKNYQIIFNKSSTLDTAVLSGVIIEKTTSGFIISGYDKEDPVFTYNSFLERAADPAITIGGVSESFVNWSSNQEYPIGFIVEYQNNFYRTKITHRSGVAFDPEKFIKLPELPIVGGATAIIRTQFTNEKERLPYGTKLSSIQEVVDFLVGYDVHLRQQGFKFEYFNRATESLEDMQLCIKEFLFWTTQNWDVGTVLTVSPVANRVEFERNNFVVDDIFDSFYDYNLLAGDGTRISREFSNIFRDSSNQFGVKPIEIQDGIYLVKLPLVQKEHVILIDNITEFNDVIFDKVPGYRQERIRVIGYRTADWNGGLNIPGFFYDDAKVTLWEPWKDYAIGDLVKYKEFFYSANKKHNSEEIFNANNWNILLENPESKLYPNWDYRANQFADFYDLDSDNFDSEQQRLAQHLIGYQKRDYLANIIVDDVSQYKFYQGYIQDKGTLNSLTNLFDALSSADRDSLEFYEEWAIRLGQYGAVENIKEIEYILDERKFRLEPQAIELTTELNNQRLDLVYEIPSFETYLKYDGYDHKPFRTIKSAEVFSKDSGYVRDQDINLIVGAESDILGLNISTVPVGHNIWALNIENTWEVYRHVRTDLKIVSIQDQTTRFVAIFDRYVDLEVGEIVGINSLDEIINGFYKVEQVSLDRVTFTKRQPPQAIGVIDDSTVKSITKLVKRRFKNIDEVNSRFNQIRDVQQDRIWLDDFNNDIWAVLDNKNVFSLQQDIFSPLTSKSKFAESFDANEFNNILVVGSPFESVPKSPVNSGAVRIYTRPSEASKWVLFQGNTEDVTDSEYGKSVAVSPDSKFIAVGAPGKNSNQGAVYVYQKSEAGVYRLLNDFPVYNPVSVGTGRFGSKIEFTISESATKLFVNAPGNDVGVVYVYELVNNTWELVSQINDIDSSLGTYERIGEYYDVNKFGDMLITSTIDPENNNQFLILIYRINEFNKWILSQTIPYTSEFEAFGSSFAINDSGNKIAIGAPRNDAQGTDNGCVYVYEQVDGEFELNQTIYSPYVEYNEMFGDFVDFDSNKLVISSKNGDLKTPLSFDDKTSTFDNNATTILDRTRDVGKVYVYQEINGKFIFGEDLNKVDPTDFVWNGSEAQFSMIEKIRFNSVNNVKIINGHIYIALPDSKNKDNTYGSLLDCRANESKDSWSVLTTQESRVDVTQFKKCFIYSKSQNKILSDLDIIDPRQGKIAAPAEQELSFKTFYDPAIYSSNIDSQTGVVVDSENAWTTENVGKLWWNLSTSSWYNPYQGSTIYRSTKWSDLIANSTIQICEWVETTIAPKEWRLRADTPEGLTKGISGLPLYDNDVYSVKKDYDPIAGKFTNKYYYWVVNSTIVPPNPFRLRSALEIAQLIASPESLGYRFVAPLGNNRFALHNVRSLIEGQDSVIHFTLVDNNENENNIHSEYQLLTESLASSKPNVQIEKKWIDSLIGYDENKQPVPDPNLSLKEKYGVLNRPMQGMFVNRFEALKQFIERVNSILIKNQITDNYEFGKLLSKDEIPNEKLGRYDIEIDSRNLLRFVSVARVDNAILEPVIENGRIVSVNIVNGGRGYKVSPSFKIITKTGNGAVIDLKLDSVGKVIEATVRKQGKNYAETDIIEVRKFAALIKNDETLNGRWSIVEWDKIPQQWNTVTSQSFDTNNFWYYVDWYADGYTSLSLVDFVIDQSYKLFALNDKIGDIVKINNIGTGGWLLLEKIDEQDTEDYSINYKVVGRENGTIQLSTNLYDYAFKTSGYDVALYDSIVYDSEPVDELRNIIETLRDNIFVGNLEVEWNNVFFASIRYIFSEQKYVDWIFKTSFVRAVHNLGELEQKVTFQNDNLESYEAYVNEVKPYSTKIREYVSNYSRLELTRSSVTDFDLPPSYDPATNIIEVSNAVYADGKIVSVRPRYENYPFKYWVDNVGFDLIRIEVLDGGEGYLETPRVTIGGNSGATARAYLAKGRVSSIEITNKGSMVLSKPEVTIEGALREGGRPARVVSVIGNSVIRTPHVTIKFDRVNSTGIYDTLETVEEFTGTGAQETFILKWPMDTNSNRFSVFLDDVEQLSSEIVVGNLKDASKGYTRELGYVTFNEDPAIDAKIRVEYHKNVNLLSAVDRINFFYNPTAGMPGKDLAQLMDGVEYGGVILDSYGFGTDQGWDVGGWGGQWDTYNIDSEGNFQLPDDSYDTALTGGSFNILSAAGTEAGEIVVDGDGFVTPTTSKGPEELIPGQLGDVLDLKVYHRASEGAAFITSASYRADGEQNEFALPSVPISSEGVIVKINEVIIPATEYSINYTNNTLEFNNTPADRDLVAVIATGVNGVGLINFESFVYDGVTIEQITSIQWREDFTSLITANGRVLKINEDYFVEESIDEDDISNRIKIVFNQSSIAEGELIQYAIYDDVLQTYSQVLVDNTFEADGGKVYHTFDEINYPIPFNKQPLSHSILVKVGNRILNPGYSVRYTTTLSRDYDIEKWQFADITGIRKTEMLVFADGVQVAPEDFIYDNVNAFIRILRNDIAPPGSELEIYVISEAEYYFVDTKIFVDTNLTTTIAEGDNLILTAADSSQLQFTVKQVGADFIVVETYNRQIRDLYSINSEFVVNGETVVNVTDVQYILGEGITFKDAPLAGASVEIYQFSNHDINDFARKTYKVINNSRINANSPDYMTRNLLAEGIIELKTPSVNANYVWVIKDGILLTPNVDYTLENNTRIKLAVRPTLYESFDILQYRSLTPVLPKFGYRLFKDVIGRTHFKRLNENNSYLLAEPLNYYDIRIKLVDATGVAKPNRRRNIPGVLFIEGERIEYFEVKGNTLMQLRRGTLGTSIKEVYDSGTKLYGQGIEENVKYRDQFITKKELATGDNVEFDLGFDISDLLVNYTTFTGRSNIEPVDFIEVFVGGRRLRKKSLNQYDATVDQDSPEADIVLPPEFEIDIVENKIILNQAPESGVRVEIVRRLGKIWNEFGKSLAESETSISKFLRDATIELPK
jgi:hypothetical protein